MSEILNAIRKNLPDSLIWKGDTPQSIELTEEDVNSECQLVVLYKQKNEKETLTIHADYKSEKDGLGDVFEQLEIECESDKKCDYIIFCETPKKTIVLLIDLKSGNTSGWMTQVKQGRLIAEDCLVTVAQQLGIDTLSGTEFRAVVFATKNVNQMTPRVNRQNFPPWKDGNEGMQFARMDCNSRNPYLLKMFVS